MRVQEFVTGESATYNAIRYLPSKSASHSAVFSFPTFVKACLPRWSDTDAWLRYEVDAPAASKTASNFLPNASTGTCRLTGKLATVFRFVLFRPSSAKSFCDLDPALIQLRSEMRISAGMSSAGGRGAGKETSTESR